jgi:hypothetical protein
MLPVQLLQLLSLEEQLLFWWAHSDLSKSTPDLWVLEFFESCELSALALFERQEIRL